MTMRRGVDWYASAAAKLGANPRSCSIHRPASSRSGPMDTKRAGSVGLKVTLNSESGVASPLPVALM